MTTNRSDKVTKVVLAAAAAGVCTFLLIKHHKKIINNFERAKNLILYDIAKVQRKSFNVQIINDPSECGEVIKLLREHCQTFNVLGFDCEWVTVNNERRKVALIQLCSDKGLCALFRVCKFIKIPVELRQILEDPEIIKCGIACSDDASKLLQDYAIKVNGTFDIRFLALLANHKGEGLARLSKAVLNIELDKNWRISCSDWESHILTSTQIDYAAKDSFVAVEIFKKLYNMVRPNMIDTSEISRFCDQYTDISFKNKLAQLNLDPAERSSESKLLNGKNKSVHKMLKRSYTKSKNLYDNCLLQAPDGTVLCTCDRRKAEWYLSKNLGTEIVRTDNELTVRLNFQPAGMPVGYVGEYYQARKENECVVCGRKDELIKKNVVPHEYRKFFPVIMKEKSSHDIVLLCFHCHQTSNISDIKIRKYLEVKCNAPYELPENQDEIKKFKSIQRTARALLPLKNGSIPENRKMELLKILGKAFPDAILTPTFIQQIAYEKEPAAKHKTSHGELVVEYFKKQGGIVELEKLFRQHFLDTMQPQYLPKLWNVNFSVDRLCIRAIEKRVDPEDLQVAGVDEKVIKRAQSTVMLQANGHEKLERNNNSLKEEDDSDSVSMVSFQSAASTLNGSDNYNQTDDERFFSDTTTIGSFYETIRSEDSANLSDFRSFENSCNEDSDSSTVVGSDAEDEALAN